MKTTKSVKIRNTKNNKLSKTKKRVLIGGKTNITPLTYPIERGPQGLGNHERKYRIERAEILKLQKMRYILQQYSKFNVYNSVVTKELYKYMQTDKYIKETMLEVENFPEELKKLPGIIEACNIVNMKIVTDGMDSVLEIAQENHYNNLQQLIDISSPSDASDTKASKLNSNQLFIGHYKLFEDIDYLGTNNTNNQIANTNQYFSDQCKEFAIIETGIKNALENNVILILENTTPEDDPEFENGINFKININKLPERLRQLIGKSINKNVHAEDRVPSVMPANATSAVPSVAVADTTGLNKNEFSRNTDKDLYDTIGKYFSNFTEMNKLGKPFTEYLEKNDIFRFYLLEWSNTYLNIEEQLKIDEIGKKIGKKHSDDFYTYDTMPMVNCRNFEVKMGEKPKILPLSGYNNNIEYGITYDRIDNNGTKTYSLHARVKGGDSWTKKHSQLEKDEIYEHYYRLKHNANISVHKDIIETYKEIIEQFNKFEEDNKYKVECCLYKTDPEAEMLNVIVQKIDKFRTELMEQYCGSEWFVICAEPLRLNRRVKNFKRTITTDMDDFSAKMQQNYTSWRRTKYRTSRIKEGVLLGFTTAGNAITKVVNTLRENWISALKALLAAVIIGLIFNFVFLPIIAPMFATIGVSRSSLSLFELMMYEGGKVHEVGSVVWSGANMCRFLGLMQGTTGFGYFMYGLFQKLNTTTSFKNNIPPDIQSVIDEIENKNHHSRRGIIQDGGMISSGELTSKNYLNTQKEINQVGGAFPVIAALGLGIKGITSLSGILHSWTTLAANMTLKFGEFGFNAIRALPETVAALDEGTQNYPTVFGFIGMVLMPIFIGLCTVIHRFLPSDLYAVRGGGPRSSKKDIIWDIINKSVRFFMEHFISWHEEENDIERNGGKKKKSFKNRSGGKKNKSSKNNSSLGVNNQTAGGVFDSLADLLSMSTPPPPPPPPPKYEQLINTVLDFIKQLYDKGMSISSVDLEKWIKNFLTFISTNKILIMMIIGLLVWVVSIYKMMPKDTKWEDIINSQKTRSATHEMSDDELNSIQELSILAGNGILEENMLEVLYTSIDKHMPYNLTSDDIIKEVKKQMKIIDDKKFSVLQSKKEAVAQNMDENIIKEENIKNDLIEAQNRRLALEEQIKELHDSDDSDDSEYS